MTSPMNSPGNSPGNSSGNSPVSLPVSSPTPPTRWTPSVIGLLFAIFCSSMASLAGVVALGKQVFDITHRELDLGWLGLVEFIPAAALVFVTGAVSDRFPRRVVVCIALIGESAAAIALMMVARTHPHSTTPILIVVFAFGIFRAFVAPAARAMLGDIVAPDVMPWLVARFSLTWQMALIIGPVTGGIVYKAAGASAVYAMQAVVLLVGSAAILFVTKSPTKSVDPASQRRMLRDAFDGLHFIRAQPVMLGAISLDLFGVLFGGAAALLPAIAEKRLHVGAVGLGWLQAAAGIGAFSMTTVLAVRPLRRRVGRTLLIVVFIFGAATIVLGVTTTYAVAFAARVVLSAAARTISGGVRSGTV